MGIKYRGDPEEITKGVLGKWFAGKGVEVSWERLISTLRESDLSYFTDQLQMALENMISEHTTLQ